MHFCFISVVLLYGYHRHVSAFDVAIFRVVSERIQKYVYSIGITQQLKSKIEIKW
jgi:hypothetical protein